MEYITHLLIIICIYSILAQSFNLIFGVGRLFNLAHIASYSIGAYTTALLSVNLNVPFFQCIIASMLLSGFFALLIGVISLKLSQDYFAIGTLAFSSVISALLINWRSLTSGVLGIPGIPRPEILSPAFANQDYNSNFNFLFLAAFMAVLSNVIMLAAFKGRYGRSLRSQAECESAALSLGKNTRLIRNLSFFTASAFAGLAGSLFAYYINYIDPSSFSLSEMIFVLTVVTVGKPGSFKGAIIATVFLVLLPEALRFVEISPAVLGPMRQLLYALVLFVVVYFSRATLFPLQREL